MYKAVRRRLTRRCGSRCWCCTATRARARCGEDGKSQERTSQRRGRKNEQMGLATTLKNVKLKKKLQPYS